MMAMPMPSSAAWKSTVSLALCKNWRHANLRCARPKPQTDATACTDGTVGKKRRVGQVGDVLGTADPVQKAGRGDNGS